MLIKNISFTVLMLTNNCACGSAFASGLIITQIQNKEPEQLQQIFTQAEKHEQDFINARAQCLEANDCDTNQAYAIARYNALRSSISLLNHPGSPEKKMDKAYIAGEKKEAKELRKRLTELLKNTQ